MCEGRALFMVDCDEVEGACGGHEVLPIGLLMRPRSDCGQSCEWVNVQIPSESKCSWGVEEKSGNRSGGSYRLPVVTGSQFRCK